MRKYILIGLSILCLFILCSISYQPVIAIHNNEKSFDMEQTESINNRNISSNKYCLLFGKIDNSIWFSPTSIGLINAGFKHDNENSIYSEWYPLLSLLLYYFSFPLVFWYATAFPDVFNPGEIVRITGLMKAFFDTYFKLFMIGGIVAFASIDTDNDNWLFSIGINGTQFFSGNFSGYLYGYNGIKLIRPPESPTILWNPFGNTGYLFGYAKEIIIEEY